MTDESEVRRNVSWLIDLTDSSHAAYLSAGHRSDNPTDDQEEEEESINPSRFSCATGLGKPSRGWSKLIDRN